MCSLTLFHEIPEHHIRAQDEPNNVQHEEGDHKARRERGRVLGEARVEQREHHKLGQKRNKSHNRAPKALQSERRERCEDHPQDHRAECNEAAKRGLKSGRQHKEREELRGVKHAKPPSPRQHDQADHRG